MVSSISGYSFTPSDLRVGERLPGISAFMRIRNGADFLEATIRSHVDHVDEIVALYNQCTDETPDILARLAAEFGPRLKVFHYEDRVFPPGSSDHAKTDPTSPNSLVNYYNAALARTSHQIATKLDDDHLAIPEALAALTRTIRGQKDAGRMWCFSGLNLTRATDGTLAIPAADPVSGGGDIGFFPVLPDTCFVHDRRFERFRRAGLKRVFSGFLYWHLKLLKKDMGFGNYEIEAYPDSRYAARRAALDDGRNRAWTLPQLVTARKHVPFLTRAAALFSSKEALRLERDAQLVRLFEGMSLEDALARMSDPAMLAAVLGRARTQ